MVQDAIVQWPVNWHIDDIIALDLYIKCSRVVRSYYQCLILRKCFFHITIFSIKRVSQKAIGGLKPRLHQDKCYRIHLYPLVAVNMFLVSATKLLPVCRPSVGGYKGIQVELCRRDTVNVYPERATCIWRHVSVDIYVSGYMSLVRDTCFRATCLLV